MYRLRHRRTPVGIATLISCVIALTGFQGVSATQAQAATTHNTVMVTTQRMSAASLNSHQNGVYAAGRHLNLICSVRGQSVKGYFSRYISGGWDNLWYLVDDGYWMADVDLQTYSNNAVVGACPTGPVGIPMVTTQRMKGASLSSGQAGSYSQFNPVTLSCWARGQSVKGYFSRYISGGWDNLWYRTGDGYWIADVDVQTGSSSTVGPQCGQPSASTKAQRAVSWGLGQIGSQNYNFMCGQFIANAYGKGNLGYANAISFYNALRSAGQIHSGTAPAGALVFSRSSLDLGNGHVDIAVGNGTYVSGGVAKSYHGIRGYGSTVQLLPNWNPSPGSQYLGWAYAPASWPGR